MSNNKKPVGTFDQNGHRAFHRQQRFINERPSRQNRTLSNQSSSMFCLNNITINILFVLFEKKFKNQLMNHDHGKRKN